ncbi:hypothetical protein [Tautonia sociabilis]|uniref:SPOR domain-containing protein n=1 Tax=Tautonia sociabilis TaxID=2080755 RepID=A0A432MFW7_9BACT|nr:hypothetical protein [Tautonia sociabilis]RUL85040.1 hypothetical protein TsocGM_19055 [Tautonia sociabilis]
MKTVLFSTSMALALAAVAPGPVVAQAPGGTPRRASPTPVPGPLTRPFAPVPSQQPTPPAPAPAPITSQATGGGDATEDGQVFQNGAVLPAPVDPGEEGPPPNLPNEPLEPYLLTTDAGPFMVVVHTFRGDFAVRKAQALAIELRREYRLPAYVWFLKLKPGNSNIRGIPPTAERGVNAAYVGPPESDRVIDEAVVLVGNCPTIEDADELRSDVKKLKPRATADHHSIFPWRNGKGLERAFITTNPLLAAQDLYPGRGTHSAAPALPAGAVVDPEVLRSKFVPKVDPLVVRLNKGTPHSIYKCPAPYSLVVAEFTGRSALVGEDPSKIAFPKLFDDSPLRTAHEDAEKLAATLAKHEVVRSLGVQPYVYHDRTSSRVLLGGFQSPNDPRLEQVRQAAMTIEYETKREGDTVFRQHLAPAASAFPVPRPE